MLDFLGPFTLVFYFIIGLSIGMLGIPKKVLKIGEIGQTVCLAVVLFCLGASLGLAPNFLTDLRDAGIQSLCYAVASIVMSVAVVYPITRLLFYRKREKKQ